ncbi:MAG: UDP-3-O-(3-hydroxymyristoyl)glucosamine N-acyltransferase [Lentisphaerae bacterium RIFOXYB12_FULL_65_16]|nr:MAG: UDP-3-O-(3-hydroxymyristoyl)glucosamine N-acyltransferase [Lentisphaerae bacterium RIFOXYA12_64_32]OGV93818.1 MAG: UDP-3-O-(3-hydroxymyristoyl)glucosamine N-acyltransferase [Lentisphaerae bacterium RIFOXYB12_FULL_65_16]
MQESRSKTSGEVAALTGGRLVGPDNLVLTGVASLDEATATDVSFLGNEKYRAQVLPSRAGVVLVPEDFAEPPPQGRAWIVSKNASAVFAKVVQVFAPPPVVFPPGRHPAAVVDPTATVPGSVHVGACAVVEAGAVIGEGTVLAAGCYIGHDARIGANCLIYPSVSVRERCRLGDRVIIHCNSTIGSDGFGYIPGPTGHTKIPQVGIVQIDDDVEIGANVTVDRARFGRTWIKRGTKIDNLVQVAHNVVIGEHCFVIAQVGISGSTRIGRGVVLWGQAGLAGHLNIGDGAMVMAQCGVPKDVPAGAHVVGSPAMDRREFVRTLTVPKQLEKLKNTVKELQSTVAELKKKLDAGS